MSGASLVFPFPAGVKAGGWTLDQGVDLSAPAHTPLLAVEPGTVTYQPESGFGPNVAILHGDSGQAYYYGHAGPGGEVKPGSHVTAGTQIGEVGAGIVGHSTGPHLELGLANPATGAPANYGSATLEGNLRTAKRVTAGGGGYDILGNALIGATPIGGLAQLLTGGDAAGAASQAANAIPAPGDLAGGIVNSIFGSVSGSITKFMLYAVFIIGGVVLAGYGLSKMIGVSPARLAGRAAATAAL